MDSYSARVAEIGTAASRRRSRAAGDDQWITAVSRHWNLDRPDPR